MRTNGIIEGPISIYEIIAVVTMLAVLATMGFLSYKGYKDDAYGSPLRISIARAFTWTSVSEKACSDAAGLVYGAYGDEAFFKAVAAFAGTPAGLDEIGVKAEEAEFSGTAATGDGRWCLLKFSGSGSVEKVFSVVGGVPYEFLEIERLARTAVSKEGDSLSGTSWTPPKKVVPDSVR